MRRASQLKLVACAAVVVAALAACSKSSTSATSPDDTSGVLGTYVLKTVAGSPPPGVYYLSASQRIMLDTATIRITAANTFSDIRTTQLFDPSEHAPVTTTRTGTYTTSGNDITFSFINGVGVPATETLTLSGRTLTVTEQGVLLTFTK